MRFVIVRDLRLRGAVAAPPLRIALPDPDDLTFVEVAAAGSPSCRRQKFFRGGNLPPAGAYRPEILADVGSALSGLVNS